MHAESPEDLYKRVKSFFNEVDPSKNILVVTHSGVLRMAMLLLQHPRSFSKKAFLTAQQFRAKNAMAFQWDAAGLSEYINSAQKVR
jgi:broad specificity phosphatase PhoE